MNNAPRIFIFEEDNRIHFRKSDRWSLGLATFIHVYAVMEPESEHRLEIISMVANGRIYWLSDHPVILRLWEEFPGLSKDAQPLNATIRLDPHSAILIKMHFD